MGLGDSLYSRSSISFAGLSTGLDTDSIIQQLLAIEQRPLIRLQSQQLQLQNRLSLYQQFSGRLAALRAAGDALNTITTYNATRATSSDDTKATLSVGTGAQPGIYTLAISQLAQAHKISSAAQTDSTSALGLSGTFLINEKVIEVAETDTLAQIASRINAAGAGVVASVISGGTGNTFLTLTSEKTGAASAIRMSNVGDSSVLDSLGLQGTATTIREPTTNGALSATFSDPNTALGPLLKVTNFPPGNLSINSMIVSIDLMTDTLTSIAQKINQAEIPGVTASVETIEEGGTTKYQLKIVGDSGTPTFVDDNHILENLGILQATPSNQLLAAQDAEYSLDGVNLTSSSNTITSVIAGGTLNLLEAGGGPVTLSVSRDLDAVKASVNNFVSAYNTLRDFVSSFSQFDPETFQSGPLFGDYNITANMDIITARMTGAVAGLSSGALNSLALIGVSLGEDGKLSVNDSTLTSALNDRLDSVKSLFMAVGTPSNPYVQFLSATSKTRTSPTAGYEVVITQAATKASTTAVTAQAEASTEVETLTFSGSLFGNTPVSISLNVGNTVDDTIAQINSHASLRGLVTASKDSEGKLVLTSAAYGSSKSFTVTSDQEAGSNNSGIGTTEQQAVGLDVAGTINGEAASGNGQILTGDDTNEYTAGLALLITASSPGTYGTVTFTRGIAASVSDAVATLTDPTTGALTEQDKQLQAQIDDLDAAMERIQETVTRRGDELKRRFAQLESLVASLQAQQARLTMLMKNWGSS
ncbi:MAG: flagellar filament capping protein FliD [Fimbriimonadia bacterium]|jgi:flagellar hook-associated protein 2